MRIRVLIILLCILISILTIYFLNNKMIYAKEAYTLYALQAGAFKDYNNALNYANILPSKIIIEEEDLYKVYVGIYNNIDLANKMILYFENNNINVYLKKINVKKSFYDNIDNYERFLNNSDNKLLYDNVNQSILSSYIESINQ